MSKLNVILRENLSPNCRDKNFLEISCADNPGSIKPVVETEMTVFIDSDGSTRVLKNRYGMTGVVVYDRAYKNYLRLVKKEAEEERKKLMNENNQLDSGAKKKSFLGRIFGK